MVIRTMEALNEWLAGAEAEFGDPSISICLLACQWRENIESGSGDDLACGIIQGELVLRLHGEGVLPVPVVKGKPEISPAGTLDRFGSECIAPGVWALSPSLNMPELIHAYVILCGVPEKAPWGQKIVIATEMPAMGGL